MPMDFAIPGHVRCYTALVTNMKRLKTEKVLIPYLVNSRPRNNRFGSPPAEDAPLADTSNLPGNAGHTVGPKAAGMSRSPCGDRDQREGIDYRRSSLSA